jgi:hypothetical protein
MSRAKTAARRSPLPAHGNSNDNEASNKRRGRPPSGKKPMGGLRERKKARLRQQIVETALHLFRQRGYENTRIDDIVHTLEISQPTFFRYSPAKMQYCVKWDAAPSLARPRASSPSCPRKPPPSNACGGFTKLWETRQRWGGRSGRP